MGVVRIFAVFGTSCKVRLEYTTLSERFLALYLNQRSFLPINQLELAYTSDLIMYSTVENNLSGSILIEVLMLNFRHKGKLFELKMYTEYNKYTFKPEKMK